jgi:hypothetical protein
MHLLRQNYRAGQISCVTALLAVSFPAYRLRILLNAWTIGDLRSPSRTADHLRNGAGTASGSPDIAFIELGVEIRDAMLAQP